MNRTINILVAVILLVFAAAPETYGQLPRQERDKYTLLTMPYNMRPLTLYRGQLKADAGYKFAVKGRKFDNDGNPVQLRTSGTGSVYHYYFADIRYGLLDFVELGAETSYIRHGVRSESVTYTSVSLTSAERVTVNQLKEIKGFSDILFNATVRLPIKYKWFDLSAKGGIYVPSAEYKQEKPEHRITNITAADSYTANYKYNYTNGFGVPVYLLASQVKFTFRKLSLQAGLTFRTPAREGTSIRWEENLVEKTFIYYDQSYKYLLSDAWFADLAVHYQATGWFDIFVNVSREKTTGGWTEYWGNKYKNRETELIMIEPCFELQISPSLTVCQNAGFPVAGKNSDAPFYLFTTIRFSNFPFFR
ncbi:MAG TPA: hypothetical protein PK496_03765 [Bacteroidales bacterium]|nr:hypothetical protein [Bacteroidales bacterium]